MVKDEYSYFREFQDDIVTGHVGEYVVVKDHTVQGYFKSVGDAINGAASFPLGTFIIQPCKFKADDVVHFFNREISFV
jgi:hypothetical protein